MAESQDPFTYSVQLHAELDAAISPSRLAPYLAAASGDRDMAIKTYLWNARIAKAFLFPIHVAEVTARNAMHEAFSHFFGGPSWMDPTAGQLYQRLTTQSQGAILKALDRLAAAGIVAPTPDDIVATLTFDFWSNLFRGGVGGYKWLWPMTHPTTGECILDRVFPHLPAGAGRGYVKARVADINHFRNRIAHHEPVYYKSFNHKVLHAEILKFIGFRCPATSEWTKRHSTAMAVTRTAPTRSAYLPGKLLKTVTITPPPVLAPTDTLDWALSVVQAARPPIALVPDPTATPQHRLVTAPMLLEFISTKAAELGGMIDVTASTVADVVAVTPAVLIDTIDVEASTGDVAAKFFPSGGTPATRPQALLVMNGGAVVGAVTRPEFRY